MTSRAGAGANGALPQATRQAPRVVDGRTARRDRNRTAVLDAVLDLFSEENLAPSPEDVARRSGVSLRSVYRYVSDADGLLRAAIERHLEHVAPLFLIQGIGEGPFEQRLETFVTTRLHAYEAIAPTLRASRLRAAHNDIIREQLADGRRRQREQFELQFAPELGRLAPQTRRAVVDAGDVLSQMDTLEVYCHARGCSRDEAAEMLLNALRILLIRSIDT